MKSLWFRSTNSGYIFSVADRLVFRSIIKISSVKSPTTVLNAQSENQVTVTLCRLGRPKFLYVERQFRAVWFKYILEQSNVALDAIEEQEMFEWFMESSAWLAEVTSVPENLLRSKKLIVRSTQTPETLLRFRIQFYFKTIGTFWLKQHLENKE